MRRYSTRSTKLLIEDLTDQEADAFFAALDV